MRIALLADIHGNLTALDAVLAELASALVDQVLCLGDVAIFGPQPRATLARLRGLGCPMVMGNTDAWALAPQPHPFRNADTPKFNAIELWGAAQLTDADRQCIRTFQPTVTVDLGVHGQLMGYHGSPRSYYDAIVAATPDAELAHWFGARPALLMAGGHTHAPFVRRFGDSLVMNPGSVGLPYENRPDGRTRNPPWAEYAIVTTDGGLSVELRRTPVDVGQIAQAARQSEMPFAEWWLDQWRVAD
jgi:predicted phosphodiesterase